MLWKKMLKVKMKNKKIVKSCEKQEVQKLKNVKKWLLQKDCEKKIFEKFEKEWFIIVDICRNEMLSSIALKNGSFVLKIV